MSQSPSASNFADMPLEEPQLAGPTLFGHPTGLFTLFFAEMWERFSYYGMRALLIFYMTKGFLGFGDSRAYQVYAAYGALVYATPFIGGMLADKLLGTRKAVILGGLFMAAGHLLMTFENDYAFFVALALLVVGNGFFKPNISTTVGMLYPKSSKKKDAGFTIFYMGINLGAALAPLLCGYVGETYGWHYGFGLATIGMLIGLAVFIAPTVLTQLLILVGSLGAALGMIFFQRNDPLLLLVYSPVAVTLLVAAIFSAVAVGKGGIPDDVGRPPAGAVKGGLSELLVYVGAVAITPVIAVMIYYSDVAGWVLSIFGAIAVGVILIEAIRGTKIECERLIVVLTMFFFSMLFWSFFEQAGSSVNNFTDRNVSRMSAQSGTRVIDAADVGSEITFTPTQAQLGYPFTTTDAPISGSGNWILGEIKESASSVGAESVLATLNPPRGADGTVPADAQPRQLKLKDLHPSLIEGTIQWSKAVGQPVDDPAVEGDPLLTFTGRRHFTLDQLGDIRSAHRKALEAQVERKKKAEESKVAFDEKPLDDDPVVTWKVDSALVGMTIGSKEIPASIFQAVNPVCIMICGLFFSSMWGFLGRKNMEPNTAIKFGLGLLQLGLGFLAFWYGASNADPRGMTTMFWLILGYGLHTTGELCLSPVGLSMVTKLSPVRIVSMVMGGWFLATAFSHYLAGMIASLTGVSHGEEGGGGLPIPKETVGVYGEVFMKIGIAACMAAVLVFILSPWLSKWEHKEITDNEGAPRPGRH